MCLDEGAKGKMAFNVPASCSNCPAGSSAASICRTDAVQKRLAPAMVSQAAHGERGLFVLQAGHLLGVKDKGMVAQQTQNHASA